MMGACGTHASAVPLLPTAAVLVVTLLLGVAVLTVRGRRRVGSGLVVGALVSGFADAAWTCVYFVSQGS